MSLTFLAILALVPVLLPLYLRVFRGVFLSQSMLAACATAAVVGWLVWRMKFIQIVASILQGFFLSLEIIALLFVAIAFLHLLEKSRAMSAMRVSFGKISPDRRIQAILIAWFLGSGLEGVLGFGVTGGVCSAMLGGLGFPPACALMMGVMGPIVAGAFCSAGTPLLFGMTHGLMDPLLTAQVMTNHELAGHLQIVANQAALFIGVVGIFMPLLMVMMMTKFFGHSRTWTEGLSIAPFALFCGLAFSIPFVFGALFLGPEFSPMVGALIGLALAMSVVKMKLFVPKDQWDFQPEEQWESDWLGGQKRGKYSDKEWHDYRADAPASMTFWKAWLPFVLLVLLVVSVRLPQLPLGTFLQSYSFEKHNILGSSVSIVSQPFYLPITLILLLVAGLTILLHKVRLEHVRYAFGGWATAIAWLAVRIMPLTIATACIYINSSDNTSGLVGMPQALAIWTAQLPGAEYWTLFFSPFLAASLAFFGANNTFSNLMLSSFQHHLGQSLLMPEGLFLALQMVGASLGNMVSWRYLAGAGSIVGMLGWSAPIGRKTALPLLACLILVGILGFFVAHIFNFTHLFFPY